MSVCPCCRLIEGEILREVGSVVAVAAPNPIAPGHTLLIPRRHFANFSQRDKRETLDLMILLHMICSQLQYEQLPEKINAGWNDVDAAGRVVEHFHVHIIARKADDGVDPSELIRYKFGSKSAKR